MSARRTFARAFARLALFATLAGALVIGATESSSSALTLTNTKPNGLYNCNPTSTAITSACITGALSDFNAARRKEGLKAMVLPSNFARLSVPSQLFTLTNIERRDRGIPTFLLQSSTLSSIALYAANRAIDPLFPSWAREGGSNWASPKNSLWADFVWMYDDGLGSGNLDCTSSNTSGCWGHRKNILGSYGAPRIMGSALGSTGVATIMLGLDSHDLVTPYAPGSLWAPQISNRRLASGWSTPSYRGAPIIRYYVRLDSHAWASTGLRRSWTTPTLTRGYHTIGVRSYNKYGYSPVKSVRVYVR
ncbi:MAG: hypothetical protein ACTHJM_09455 [Marmoricola sp.]